MSENKNKEAKNDKVEYNKIEPEPTKDEEIEEEIVERDPQKRLVKSEVVEEKKGLARRLADAMSGPEGYGSLGGYLGKEIILPAVKNIVADSVTSAINMLMFGDSGPRSSSYHRPGQPGRISKTDYSSRYRPTGSYGSPVSQSQREPAVSERRRNMVGMYKIEDRNEALDVLEALVGNAQSYGAVSVADYYDMIGVETVFTDNSYGWTYDDLRTVTPRPMRGGYILNLPPVIKL